MTLALPQPSPRHRRANLQPGRTYVVVHPPRDHRPTSHRRSRSRLMQLSVRDLAAVHGPVRPSLPRRAGRFSLAWLANVVEPEVRR